MQVPKFKQFINEEKDSKPFLRLLIVTDEPEEAKTFHTADRLKEECDKLGYPYYLFKLTGGYTTYENGVRKFHNKEDKKGFDQNLFYLLCYEIYGHRFRKWCSHL